MIKFIFLIISIFLILFIFKNKSKNSKSKLSPGFYKKLMLILLVASILFLLSTSGRLILPQLLQILKIGAPFFTKFIGL